MLQGKSRWQAVNQGWDRKVRQVCRLSNQETQRGVHSCLHVLYYCCPWLRLCKTAMSNHGKRTHTIFSTMAPDITGSAFTCALNILFQLSCVAMCLPCQKDYISPSLLQAMPSYINMPCSNSNRNLKFAGGLAPRHSGDLGQLEGAPGKGDPDFLGRSGCKCGYVV